MWNDDADTLTDRESLEALQSQHERERDEVTWQALWVILAAIAAMIALYAAPQWPLPVAILVALAVILGAILLGDR